MTDETDCNTYQLAQSPDNNNTTYLFLMSQTIVTKQNKNYPVCEEKNLDLQRGVVSREKNSKQYYVKYQNCM